MPETQVYRFVSTTQGQKRPPRRELQRIVRSQAASVSRREHDIRRRRHVGKLNVGEDVIDLGPRPPTQAIPVSQASSAAVARRHRPSTASLPSYSFTPVSSLPTFRRPYLPTLINHYITNLTVPNPQIDGNTTLPLFRQAWVPIILHDPVIFQVIVLFTATHYATFVDSHRFNQVHQELLWLKQSALSILIAKIGSEDVASDTVIAAATKMASYEAIFGTVEAFHVHMSTVARLLRTRNLKTLGMYGFLPRLLSFVDTNSAFLLGTERYLTEFELATLTPSQNTQKLANVTDIDAVDLDSFLGRKNDRQGG